MAIKTFTTGEVLTASDTNTYLANSGLVFVSSTTIGTTVSSVTVSNCFSSTFDDYRITFSRIGNSSASTDLNLQLTSITGAVYAFAGYYQLTGVSTINAFGTTTTTIPLGSLNGTLSNRAVCEISSPNLATAKTAITDTSSNYLTSRVGCHIDSAVQSTGFTISVTGTMTGGTITVYGYRKA